MGLGQPGLNHGWGRPGSTLQAAGRARAQPPKPTHADQQVGLTWRAGRENSLLVGLKTLNPKPFFQSGNCEG